MSEPELDLHIDRLVLHDLPAYQRERVAAAIVAEIERLVAEEGLPAGLTGGGAIELPAHGVTVSPGLKPEAIGAQVAQSLFRSFTGGTLRESSIAPAAASSRAGRSSAPGGRNDDNTLT